MIDAVLVATVLRLSGVGVLLAFLILMGVMLWIL
jgi:hypothetical protein